MCLGRVLLSLPGVELLANRMEEDSEDELEEVQSNCVSGGSRTEEDAMEVQCGSGDSGGAHYLPFPSSNGTIMYVSYEDLQKCTRKIQSTVAAIPQNGNKMLIKLGNAAVECLQLVINLWDLNPARQALQFAATNAASRIRDFAECVHTNVREDQAQVLPMLLCGVQTRNRQDDNRVVPHNRSPPANSSQPNSAPDNSPQPILSQPNAAPANPACDNPPPPNSTLDTVIAATMQILDYVRKHKWWIITGAVVGGGVAAGVVVAGGGAVAASVAATFVGGGVGAVAGLAVKKVKDKCTQPPPHEHQD